MNRQADRAFGGLLRKKREALGLSQLGLCRKLGWAQAKGSRVEQGKRSVTLPELLAVARAFDYSVGALLSELESRPGDPSLVADAPALAAGFGAACESEEALLAQLSRFGVRFLGQSPRPAFCALPLDETVLAALRYMHDPRVFEALPGLLAQHAGDVDWTKLVSAANALGLQNRLGAVLATALKLEDFDAKTEALLQDAHDALAQRKLDREEVVGPRPKTASALALLRERTPDWLRYWHVLGSGDLESVRRHLPR